MNHFFFFPTQRTFIQQQRAKQPLQGGSKFKFCFSKNLGQLEKGIESKNILSAAHFAKYSALELVWHEILT